MVQQGFEDLLGGHADLFGDGDGGEIFRIDFVFAKLEGNAEGFKEARAVGFHRVGLPGSRRSRRGRRADASTQSAMGAADSRWWVVMTMVRLLLAEAGQQLDHLANRLDIHVGEGLVEQQQFRHGQQHAGQRSALAHALRVLAQGAVELGVQADLA